MKIANLLLFVLASSITSLASAHAGGQDSNGGHTDTSTGLYHCHRADCVLPDQDDDALGPAIVSTIPYDRREWRHWGDFDRDCQNARHELLIATSSQAVTFTNTNNCTVNTGQWVGPYTGQTFTLASDMDIDHVIPLSYAHNHGGAAWNSLLKKAFANDPDNLLATDDSENQSKSDQGPSAYEPPLQSYHCEYARRWKFLAAKWELNLDAADSAWINLKLRDC